MQGDNTLDNIHWRTTLISLLREAGWLAWTGFILSNRSNDSASCNVLAPASP